MIVLFGSQRLRFVKSIGSSCLIFFTMVVNTSCGGMLCAISVVMRCSVV